jgi:hypothetical protein
MLHDVVQNFSSPATGVWTVYLANSFRRSARLGKTIAAVFSIQRLATAAARVELGQLLRGTIRTAKPGIEIRRKPSSFWPWGETSRRAKA